MHFGRVELVGQHGSTRSSRRARHVERVSCAVSRRDEESQVEFELYRQVGRGFSAGGTPRAFLGARALLLTKFAVRSE